MKTTSLLEGVRDLLSLAALALLDPRPRLKFVRLGVGLLCGPKPKTITSALEWLDQRQEDWSADYRLFSQARWEAQAAFTPVLTQALGHSSCGSQRVYFGQDDTLLAQGQPQNPRHQLRPRPLKSSLPSQPRAGAALRANFFAAAAWRHRASLARAARELLACANAQNPQTGLARRTSRPQRGAQKASAQLGRLGAASVLPPVSGPPTRRSPALAHRRGRWRLFQPHLLGGTARTNTGGGAGAQRRQVPRLLAAGPTPGRAQIRSGLAHPFGVSASSQPALAEHKCVCRRQAAAFALQRGACGVLAQGDPRPADATPPHQGAQAIACARAANCFTGSRRSSLPRT